MEKEYSNLLFADNGLEALNHICKNLDIYTVVILDINMPIMDGYELLNILSAQKEKYKNVKCICVSGTPISEFQNKMSDEKYFSYIEKPFAYQKLKNIINSCFI
jgi:CheY-like chemotaxis protein